MTMYSQPSKLAKSSIVATTFVILLFIGIGIGFFFLDHEIGSLTTILLLVTLIGMIISAMYFFPRLTMVDNGSLVIAFPLRKKVIALSEINDVEPYRIPADAIRLCGSGAFFGWWGWYRAKDLGRFMVYAANLDDTILVRLRSGKKYVISCSNPASMASAILRERK